MADSEQKALQLMAEAEKKLTTSKGFLSSLFGCVIFHVNFCDEKIDSMESSSKIAEILLQKLAIRNLI